MESKELRAKQHENWSTEKKKIAKLLLELFFDCGAIKTWYRHKKDGWTLRNGSWSPVYISLRGLSSKVNGFSLLSFLGHSINSLISNEIDRCDKLLGVAMGGIPIVVAVTLCSGIPSLYTRVERKEHGQKELIEGDLCDTDRVVVVDDVATSFSSIVDGITKLYASSVEKEIKVLCTDAVVVVDREQGAEETARRERIVLHSLIRLKSDLHLIKDKFDPHEYAVITDYLQNPNEFQTPKAISELIGIARSNRSNF